MSNIEFRPERRTLRSATDCNGKRLKLGAVCKRATGEQIDGKRYRVKNIYRKGGEIKLTLAPLLDGEVTKWAESNDYIESFARWFQVV